jgi:hypothetical protein
MKGLIDTGSGAGAIPVLLESEYGVGFCKKNS